MSFFFKASSAELLCLNVHFLTKSHRYNKSSIHTPYTLLHFTW